MRTVETLERTSTSQLEADVNSYTLKLLHGKALTQEQTDALQVFLGDLAAIPRIKDDIEVTRDRALRG